MKITKELIKKKFKEYNDKYFNSILPKCEFSACKLHCFGQYTCAKSKSSKRNRIWITTDVDWTEETLKDVLIHEMIHHYVTTVDGCELFDGFSWYGLFGHGKHFRKQVNRLKKEFGLNVHIHYPFLKKKKEKIPTSSFQKLLRFINYSIN